MIDGDYPDPREELRKIGLDLPERNVEPRIATGSMRADVQISLEQLEEMIDKAGSITLERLQRLVQRGYRPDFGGEFEGALLLYHPRKTFDHKMLYFYGSGLVVSSGYGSGAKSSWKPDEFRFEREDTERFNNFLKSVPLPSFSERTRRGRINVYVWLFIAAVYAGGGILGLVAYEFIKAIWH